MRRRLTSIRAMLIYAWLGFIIFAWTEVARHDGAGLILGFAVTLVVSVLAYSAAKTRDDYAAACDYWRNLYVQRAHPYAAGIHHAHGRQSTSCAGPCCYNPVKNQCEDPICTCHVAEIFPPTPVGVAR